MGVRKKVGIVAGAAVLLLGLAGCGKDYDAGNLTRHAETVSDEKDAPRNIEKFNPRDYALDPTELYTIKQPLYESDDGKIILEGYQASGVKHYYIYLKITGNLTTADQGGLRLRVILDNGESVELSQHDRINALQSGNEEYHVYETTIPKSAGKIVRVDTSLEDDIDGNFDDENAITTEIEDKREDTEVIPGTYTIGTNTIPVNITKENDDIEVEIKSLDFVYQKTKQVKINGSVTFKGDTSEDLRFSYVEPVTQEIDESALDVENTGPYYKDTTVDFTHTLKTSVSMGKGNQIYFTVNGVLFALDLESGEEPDTVDVTKFEQESKYLVSKETLAGFKDIKGNSVYDAIMLPKPFAHYNAGDDQHSDLTYGVNGYKKLIFDVGTEESGAEVPTSYDLYVYGDDYYMSEGLSKPEGKVLYHQKINNKTKMDTVDIKVKGQNSVTFYIDSNIPAGGDEDVEENYLPVIFSNVILEK